MAEGEIPNKIGHAIRVAVFWISLPFIGLLLAGDRYFAELLHQVVGFFWFSITEKAFP